MNLGKFLGILGKSWEILGTYVQILGKRYLLIHTCDTECHKHEFTRSLRIYNLLNTSNTGILYEDGDLRVRARGGVKDLNLRRFLESARIVIIFSTAKVEV